MKKKVTKKAVKKKPVKKVVKKTVKKVKKLSPLEELKKQVLSTIKAGQGKKPKVIEVFTIKREHYNNKLSVPGGFGFQDMKAPYKQLIVWLTTKYTDSVAFKPGNYGQMELKVSVKA